MFLIGTRILSGTVSAEQAGEAFARLADVLIRSLHRAIEEQFAEQHGRIAGQETAILALGKLGGREMTATSDLDLIVVYDFDHERPESNGPRPLYGGAIFRAADAAADQRADGADQLRRALPGRYAAAAVRPLRTARDPDRRLCQAIRRTKPGPGSTWRSRARASCRLRRSSPRASKRSSAPCCAGQRDAEMIAGDVVEMREAIAKREGRRRALGSQICRRRADRHRVHRAISAACSRGRRRPDILDTSTARVLDKAWRLGVLPAEDADVLRPAVRLYHDLTQILRLCLSGPFDPKSGGAWPHGTARAGGRRARFRHARCFPRRNAAQGARELQPHPRRVALSGVPATGDFGRAQADALPGYRLRRQEHPDGVPGRRRPVRHFSSNSTSSTRVVPILRTVRVAPGSCQ